MLMCMSCLTEPRPEGKADAPDISVVILCYQAQDLVPAFVRRMREVLQRKGLSYGLVLVANYHPDRRPLDRTPDIVRQLARDDPTVAVVARPKEGMMGWDLRSGLAVATGRTVAVIDGDGQMPPDDVVAVYEYLRQGGYDLVQTFRTVRHDGAWRRLVSCVYNIALRGLFPRIRVRDANGKPKILTREALAKLSLHANGWFIDAEIVIQATRLGFKIGEVPTVFFANEHRRSFITPWAIFTFAAHLLLYRVRTLLR
jgi:glycosyltransferase involved in cell wall biosynthesis